MTSDIQKMSEFCELQSQTPRGGFMTICTNINDTNSAKTDFKKVYKQTCHRIGRVANENRCIQDFTCYDIRCRAFCHSNYAIHGLWSSELLNGKNSNQC
jgi:hypothetical protein